MDGMRIAHNCWCHRHIDPKVGERYCSESPAGERLSPLCLQWCIAPPVSLFFLVSLAWSTKAKHNVAPDCLHNGISKRAISINCRHGWQ
jgi:hypothetical protein